MRSGLERATSLPPEVGVRALRDCRPRYMPSTQQVELSLYLLAGSGLLLWEPLGLAWALASPILVAHVVIGSALVLAVVVPFWMRHRRRLETSKRSTMRRTGRAIELSLALLIGSGFYLFFVGNRGDVSGRVAAALHLWLTLPLVALIVWHMPWSGFDRLWRALRARLARPRRSMA